MLSADGRDFYYEKWISPKRSRKHCLSDYVGEDRARGLAAKLRRVKGSGGGRLYINEFRHLFTALILDDFEPTALYHLALLRYIGGVHDRARRYYERL